MTDGPNRAGRSKVAVWGPAMSCAMFAVEDLPPGSVITARDFTTVLGSPLAADDFLPGTASDNGGRFNKDSALLLGLGASGRK
jgi:hypothetical protein